MERPLVVRARRGDQEAFGEIATAITPRLFAIAQRMLRDYHRAEDVTQQALVLIWRDLPRLTDVDRFDSWANRVLINACYGELRHAQRRGVMPSVVGIDLEHSISDATIEVADRDALERAFDRLTPEHRAVLVMTYYLDLDQSKIAETLGIPVGTVKSRVSSAREAMRAALEAEARGEIGWTPA